MLVSVNGVDLSKYINDKNYSMNARKVYESWLDGNFIEHRIYTRTKIEGEFTIALYGLDGMNTDAFLNTWNAAVSHNVVTIGVFVQNTNSFELIEAFFEFDGTFHREMINGNYCDILTVRIVER